MYGERDYKELIRTMLKTHGRRLVINVNDLRVANVEMANGLLQRPLEWLPPLELALKEVATSLNDPVYGRDLNGVSLHVGLEGSFGALHTTPRHLSASLLSHMVCVEGIVTSCSLVRPKLLRSVHYSEARKAFLMREYWDATMLNGQGMVTALNYPTTSGLGGGGVGGSNSNSNNNNGEETALTSEFGLCSYRDYQTISMQEMPERAPAGQLPRAVDVILDDDLVDMAKPGDRVQIVGVYKSLAASGGKSSVIPATFRAALIALRVRIIGVDSQTTIINEDDLYNIRMVSRRRDLFELLSRSLAPSIYGHEWVKKAVLLMLLGGIEKNLPNGTHLRGDINLMLVGDPSTAKSQMLRFVLAIAPLAIATTGRGSSGVGLTAAVTSDKETGERRLEAGAMVLADRGIVCIDEFDKMSDLDRVAIHEVMEQQTVTIAKAGIHASLNARCSVLAAANPIWGQYRETASPQENIRLPDSLLSRFDLLFIILDSTNPVHDRQISSHVLRMHRFIPSGLAEGQPITDTAVTRVVNSDDDDEAIGGGSSIGGGGGGVTTVFQKHYGQMNLSDDKGQLGGEDETEDLIDEILTIPFLKKYIHHARTQVNPVLTKAATDHIVTSYAEFRQKRDAEIVTEGRGGAGGSNEAKTFPVTPRTLETLIRLATAHAKSRLSPRVERKDARIAQEMIQYCLYKEVKKKPVKRRRKAQVSDSNSSEEDEDNGNQEDEEGEEGKEMMKRDRDGNVIINDRLEERGNSPQSRSKVTPNEAIEIGGLSLEEVVASIPFSDNNLFNSNFTTSGGGTIPLPIDPSSSSSQPPMKQVDNGIILPRGSMSQEDSFKGGFVDPSQDNNTLNLNSQNVIVMTEEGGRAVRTALHRLRSASTSAVFATNVNDIHNEISREDPAMAASLSSNMILTVLEEMQRLNQVMLSDGVIYII